MICITFRHEGMIETRCLFVMLYQKAVCIFVWLGLYTLSTVFQLFNIDSSQIYVSKTIFNQYLTSPLSWHWWTSRSAISLIAKGESHYYYCCGRESNPAVTKGRQVNKQQRQYWSVFFTAPSFYTINEVQIHCIIHSFMGRIWKFQMVLRLSQKNCMMTLQILVPCLTYYRMTQF